jgi:23S rRNA (guanosine2251-2'-O)-methyltransferase
MSGRNLSLDENSEVIGGRNVVLENLKAGRQVSEVYLENGLTAGKDERIRDIITITRNFHIPLQNVESGFLKDIGIKSGINTEGIIAIVAKRNDLDTKELLALCTKKGKEPFIIVVNNILYEENLGAILRTSAASGVDGIIIPKRDKREVTPTVERISMGGAAYVPVVRDNLFQSLDEIHDAGIKIVGVELNGEKYYYDEDLTGPIALVLGGEDAGLSAPLQKRCDQIVKIPMLGQIQSLNVSVSTGIVIYEKVRQECQN